VYTEFQAHYFFLGSLMEALISSGIKGMYEIVWGHYGKFSQTLEEYTRKTSIVAAIPLERKTQAFYPTTLVKVESIYQEFNNVISYLQEKVPTNTPGLHTNTLLIRFDRIRVEKLLVNLDGTIKELKVDTLKASIEVFEPWISEEPKEGVRA
jgi:hypothetical protein